MCHCHIVAVELDARRAVPNVVDEEQSVHTIAVVGTHWVVFVDLADKFVGWRTLEGRVGNEQTLCRVAVDALVGEGSQKRL